MKITLDLDNLLCNFCDTWNLWIFENNISPVLHVNQEVISYDWHKRIYGDQVKGFFVSDHYDCYDHIKPYEGAKDFLNYCIKNYEDVEILTHSTDESSSRSKLKFCKEHFDFDNVKYSDSTTDKYTQTQGRILIDDYTPSILNHVAYNKCPGIVFNLNESFGWSGFKGYQYDITALNPEFELLGLAYNYEEVKQILEVF